MLQAHYRECNVRRRKGDDKSPIPEARMKRTLKEGTPSLTLVPGLKRLDREVRLKNQPVIGVSSKSNLARKPAKMTYGEG